MLFAVIFLFLMVRSVSAADCGGSTACNCGDTLTSSYNMTSDLTGCTADGIIIGANNIILDCQGHTINGNNPGFPYAGINNGGELVGGYFTGGYNNVTIKNCIITGGFYSGIWFDVASYGNIINNTASSNEYGFHVFSNGYDTSHYNNLINNTAINNTLGFRIAYISYHTLVGNIANNNSNSGILLDASSHINVINNTANNNVYGGIGIAYGNYNNLTNNIANNNGGNGIGITGADYSNIINNTANNNSNGIYLTSSSNNNTIINNTANLNAGYGLYVTGSTVNTFANNVFNRNTNASVYLEGPVYYINRCTGNNSNCYQSPCNYSQSTCTLFCSGCVWGPGTPAYPVGNDVFTGNILTGGTYGFDIRDITNNSFTGNIITGNSYGIRLNQTASNNTIYNNYFNNSVNAKDGGNNFWNTTKTLGTNIIGDPYLGGNYWSDYNGQDTNGDGLGDTNVPYNSGGNILNGGDYLPLVSYAPDTTPPTITILSPANTTYSTTSVPLTFTINEPTSWIKYSLDGKANVTITGNITLTSLANGSHNVIVYANDTSGNVGKSNKSTSLS